MKLYYFLASVVTVASLSGVSAQDPDFDQHMIEVEKYMDYDYIGHDYRYLDNAFNITIDHQTFDSLVQVMKEAINYKPKSNSDYRDSVRVIVYGEFSSGAQWRIATNRLLFSPLRASYYLWITEEEAKDLIARYSFVHPYCLYDYFRNREPEWDRYMRKFMKNLRKKVMNATGNEEVINMENEKFLAYALRTNPRRQNDFMETRKLRMNGLR